MKVVILAGGFGSRLSEHTETVPKPMVEIGGLPIIWHIMKWYAKHGFTDFYLALGYKAHIFKQYFLLYNSVHTDFQVNLKNGKVEVRREDCVDWTVTLVDTGLNTMTGGRVKRMEEFIGNESFMLTYGDSLADIDLNALIGFHKGHGKMVTVSAVHPMARFGELELEDSQVKAFKEKPQTGQAWINGGYFVVEPEFFGLIEGDSTILERQPLETASGLGELMAFKHSSYWQCMDTKREKDTLEELWASGRAPWRV